MRRAVLLGTIAITIAAALASASAAPHGKVVRVERGGSARGGTPNVCILNGMTGGMCIGQPHVGERVAVIGRERVVAELAITAVTSEDSCIAPWRFTSEVVDGDPGSYEMTIALIAVPLDPRIARVVEATSMRLSGSETVLKALDRNGDGLADFEVVLATCDGQAPSSSHDPRCIDTWSDDGSGWKLGSHTAMQVCDH